VLDDFVSFRPQHSRMQDRLRRGSPEVDEDPAVAEGARVERPGELQLYRTA
jgi:hypothetical protein